MDRTKQVAQAIRRASTTAPSFTYGTWQGEEAVDANLSKVLVPGAGLDGQPDTHRFVPKAEHVAGLVPGSLVLLVGSPLCIIAKVIGNISLAEL